jgi:hypothetical protein
MLRPQNWRYQQRLCWQRSVSFALGLSLCSSSLVMRFCKAMHHHSAKGWAATMSRAKRLPPNGDCAVGIGVVCSSQLPRIFAQLLIAFLARQVYYKFASQTLCQYALNFTVTLGLSSGWTCTSQFQSGPAVVVVLLFFDSRDAIGGQHHSQATHHHCY